MKKIKKGDVVGRISYGRDIIFIVDKIIKTSNGEIYAILKGITIRIQADAPVGDLQLIEKVKIVNNMRSIDEKINQLLGNERKIDESGFGRVFPGNQNREERAYTGKILHLDRGQKI